MQKNPKPHNKKEKLKQTEQTRKDRMQHYDIDGVSKDQDEDVIVGSEGGALEGSK